ncbi:4-phosphopantoate--beta-alanine ligase [Candidatus Poribacteria bacterium]|nr:4-phosphopantoate--beta-alanine ligase [Candidatus Poribacteria bacterium]
MEIVTSIQRMRELSTRWRQTAGTTIGFVPTMGALHNGHARLIKESRSRAKVTVVSSFVNPLQFTESQDFQTYPRTPEADHS